MTATEGATLETYDWLLVPNLSTQTHTHTLSRSPPCTNALDNSPSFTSRFQPVNLPRPASPRLTLPHGHPGGGMKQELETGKAEC